MAAPHCRPSSVEKSTRRDARRFLSALRRHVARWHEPPEQRFERLLDDIVEHVGADRATLLVRSHPSGLFREVVVQRGTPDGRAAEIELEPAGAVERLFAATPRSVAAIEPLLSGTFQVRRPRGALLVPLRDAGAEVILQLEGEGRFHGGLGLVDQACQLLAADLRAAAARFVAPWSQELTRLGARVQAAGIRFEVDTSAVVGEIAPASDLFVRATTALVEDVLRVDEARSLVVVVCADERSTLVEVECDELEGAGAHGRHLLLETRLAAIGGHLRIGDERRCRPRHAYIPHEIGG